MFDFIFAFTESLRFYFDLHSEKKEIIRKKILPSLAGKTVVDYGCGVGHFTALYAQTSKEVWAYDSSEASLTAAGEMNARSNIHYQLIDGKNSWPHQISDIAIFNDSLELIPDWRELFQTIYDTLSPSGMIYITCPYFSARRTPFFFFVRTWIRRFQRVFQPAMHRVKQIIKNLEEKKEYKTQYDQTFNDTFESFLKTTNKTYAKEHFFLESNALLALLFPKQVYGDHLLYTITKTK